MHWKVVENDPCKRVVWEGRGAGRLARDAWSTSSASERRRHPFSYINEYNLPGGPLGRMAGPALRMSRKRNWKVLCSG